MCVVHRSTSTKGSYAWREGEAENQVALFSILEKASGNTKQH
jgi:hypothetical protein